MKTSQKQNHDYKMKRHTQTDVVRNCLVVTQQVFFFFGKISFVFFIIQWDEA